MPTKPPTFRPAGYRPAPNKRHEAQDPFYGTAQWKRTAEAIKKRDNYRCTEPHCDTPDRGFGGRIIAGHIKARVRGTPFDPNGADHPRNVRTFCVTCDNRHHREKGAMAHG